MKTAKLSPKQQFVLDSLKSGGRLILDDRDNSLGFCDVDGNDYAISRPTVKKLIELNLITTGARPALDFESFVPVKKRNYHEAK